MYLNNFQTLEEFRPNWSLNIDQEVPVAGATVAAGLVSSVGSLLHSVELSENYTTDHYLF